MSKSLFGKSSVLTELALLSGSLFFYAQPTLATVLKRQNNAPQQQAQVTTKQNDKSSALPESQADSSFEVTDNLRTPLIKTHDEDGEKVLDTSVPEDENPGPFEEGVVRTSVKTPVIRSDSAASQSYAATAYCLRGHTSTGGSVKRGVIAADPGVLPMGTRVHLDAGLYTGEYLVADRGGKVRGRKIDVWVPDGREASRFGKRSVRLTVLQYPSKKPRGATQQ